MDELLPGLWRWTAGDAGCVAYDAPRALVLIDPLVAEESLLDGLVERLDKPVSILQTTGAHARSRDALERRYADRLVPEPGPGVEPVPIAGAGETMAWLPEPRVLVPGDCLRGDGRGALRVPTEPPGLAEALRPVLDLPVRAVLVSHGEPVLEDGRAAIAESLAERVARDR
jgi:hypothetical protein